MESKITADEAKKLAKEISVEFVGVWLSSEEALTWLLRKLRYLHIRVEGWQDMDRIYTPAEQQLDMRIDGSITRDKPA